MLITMVIGTANCFLSFVYKSVQSLKKKLTISSSLHLIF